MCMPLIKSASNEARQANIKEMIDSGHPVKQAVAAAYANQREAERHTHEERQAERHAREKEKYGQ
jgi:ribosomal protein L12E/L44/L45/RPP1/RPP2